MALGEAIVDLGLDERQLDAGLTAARDKTRRKTKDMQDDADSAGKRIGKALGAGIKAGVKIAVAGLALLVTALGLAIREALKDEKQNSRLEKAMIATGEAAGFSAKQLKLLAEALQDATIFDDTDIKGVMSIISTFTNITGNEFKKATQASLDLAAALEIDLKSAALQLSKALSSPKDGLTALRRSGLIFTDQQKAMIVAMHEAGNAAGAQNEIFKLLKANGIDGNADATASLSDQWELFKNILSDSIVDVGMATLEILGMSSGATTLTEKMKDIRKAVRAFIDSAKFQTVKEAFAGLVHTGQLLGIVIGTIGKVTAAVFTLMIGLLKEAFMGFVNLGKFIGGAFLEGLIGVGKVMVAVFTGDFKAVPGLIKDAMSKSVGVAKESAVAIGKNFLKAGKISKDAFKELTQIGVDARKARDAIGPEFKNTEATRKLKKKASAEDAAAAKAKEAREAAFLAKFKEGLAARREALGMAKGELTAAEKTLKAEQKRKDVKASASFVGIAEASRQATTDAVSAFNRQAADRKKARIDEIKAKIQATKEDIKNRKEGLKNFIGGFKEAAKKDKAEDKKTLSEKVTDAIKEGNKEQKEWTDIGKKQLAEDKKQTKAINDLASKRGGGVFGT